MRPFRGEGCGNTFLVFDCLNSSNDVTENFIQEAHSLLIKEDRDDALILKKVAQDSSKLVLTMMVLEPDLSIAEFCGNGARVVGCYLKSIYGNQGIDIYLKTSRGLKKIWWDNDSFHVDMGPTRLRLLHSKFLNRDFEIFDLGLGLKTFSFYWTQTLEPHLVTFDPIEESELNELGLYLNHHQRKCFPLGINLNRAKILSSNQLEVTTFERGVNRITAACGTGATSCAVLAKELKLLKSNHPIEISVKGGSLTIHQKGGRSVMSGPATIEI